jgi:hypothetical protein
VVAPFPLMSSLLQLQVVMKDVVPAMERRIMTLNTTVSNSRKGMKNVIKSWWRKPRDVEDRSSDSVDYRHDQIESQILLLADSAFVMKDYDTALSMYRMVRDDFKADKALIHQGCCLVMIALCLTMLDGEGRSTRRETEIALRDACIAFQNAHPTVVGSRRKGVTRSTRLATHASFLMADVLGHHSHRHQEAAEVTGAWNLLYESVGSLFFLVRSNTTNNSSAQCIYTIGSSSREPR